MNCTCVRYTELPHMSKLFADFTYHPDRVRPFYPHIASDPGAFESIAREIRFPAEGVPLWWRRCGRATAIPANRIYWPAKER